MNVISESEKSQSEALGVNPLGTEPVGKLLRQFAVPSIVAMLVSALYNLVDQFFIGQSIGELEMQQQMLLFRYPQVAWQSLYCLE